MVACNNHITSCWIPVAGNFFIARVSFLESTASCVQSAQSSSLGNSPTWSIHRSEAVHRTTGKYCVHAWGMLQMCSQFGDRAKSAACCIVLYLHNSNMLLAVRHQYGRTKQLCSTQNDSEFFFSVVDRWLSRHCVDDIRSAVYRISNFLVLDVGSWAHGRGRQLFNIVFNSWYSVYDT